MRRAFNPIPVWDSLKMLLWADRSSLGSRGWREWVGAGGSSRAPLLFTGCSWLSSGSALRAPHAAGLLLGALSRCCSTSRRKIRALFHPWLLLGCLRRRLQPHMAASVLHHRNPHPRPFTPSVLLSARNPVEHPDPSHFWAQTIRNRYF